MPHFNKRRVGKTALELTELGFGGATIAGMGGTVVECDPPARLVCNEEYDQPWYEGQGLSTIELNESDGKTTLVLTVRYDSEAVRDQVLTFPATSGVEMSYDNLAAWLATDEAGAVQTASG